MTENKSLSAKTVRKKIEKACLELLRNDDYLLRYDLNERSITHKLAEYLQKQFKNWNVDCEYNRNADQVKIIHYKKIEEIIASSDTSGKTVYPDIVVHKRGTRNNLIVIEAKKDSNAQSPNIDHRKLESYMHDLGYRHGVFIKFVTGDNPNKKIEFL